MLDYEVYVKIIIESKQFMNFNNEISLLGIEWLEVTGIHRGNERLLWMIKNIFYKLASIAVTKDY